MTKKKENKPFKISLSLKRNSDSIINLVVFLLICFGSTMIVSTNVGQTTTNSMVVLNTFVRQIIYVGLSYLCMYLINRFFSLERYGMFKFIILPAAAFALGITQFFAESGGSKSWIRIGGFSIQPAEFVKPLVAVMIAYAVFSVKNRPKKLKNFKSLYGKTIAWIFVFLLEIFFQKDIGTLTIVFMISFVCLLTVDFPSIRKTTRNLKRLFFAGVMIILIFFCFTDIGTNIIAQTPFSHIATRFRNMKNPYDDVYQEGYQPANALYGIANSEIIGQGIGNSMRKYVYLTQADNDYIFAVMIEETGIFGLFILVILYGILFFKLFYYAFKTNNLAYKVILTGNATYLFMHFFLNVGGVTCLIPMTGVPLLFISSGGSALMAICIMIGISQNCISDIRNNELKKG